MRSTDQYKLTTPLLALIFFCGTAFAQQKVLEQPALPPLPPPIYEPGELPPLPPPTEQQLQRGREMLDKIVYVIANVPLTDAAATLKVFGFTDLRTKEYPTHADVGPKGKDSDFLSGPELKGTGLTDVTVQPWIKDPRINVTSWLNATVATEEACISIDAVRRMFGPMTSKMHSDRIVTSHPVQRPKPLHGIGIISFAPLHNPMNSEASITFAFEYQICADRFNFAYFTSSKEATK
jgi:hypothetical protein